MFEPLDDPAGVPERPGRLPAAKARGRVLRARRLAAVPAAAVLIAAAGFLAPRDDDGAVRVAADDLVATCVPVTTIPGTPPVPGVRECPPTTVTSAPATGSSLPRPGWHSSTTGTTVPGPSAAQPSELATALAEYSASGVSGSARATRTGETTWRVATEVTGLRPGERYSVLVHRPEPSHGTPFPTACSFVATARTGGCTGDIEVFEGGAPDTIAVMGPDGGAVAQGRFA